MASSQPDEENFNAHVRQLLFRYAKTHLTVDYMEWTKNTVLELLQQCLREVPVDDPASLWLPQDPFDMLGRLYSFSTLRAYEERWQTNSHALTLIKESLAGLPGKTRSGRAPFFDDYDIRYSERMTTALTMRGIRNTHRFPSHPKAVPTQGTPFFATEKTSELEDEEIPLQMERILNVTWGIHSTIREEVRKILKETLSLPARDVFHFREWSCFKDESYAQPLCIERSEWPFVPLFPRKRRPGCQTIDDTQTGKLEYFGELKKNIMPRFPTQELEFDLFNDDMRAIDDWGVFQTSSPSTLATLTSSQEDRKIDRLFIGSSPNTELYPIEALEAAKMETVMMPRSLRLGGTPEHTKSITDEHSFASFILQYLSGTGPGTSDLVPSSLPPDCISSLAGQAPSSGLSEVSSLFSEDDDRTLFSLYASVDPKDVWHGETLDEKNTVLMEVPTLPSPSNHPPGPLFLPSSFRDFVPASSDEQGAVHRYLRKVKGLQPLRVTLSWMAFTTNEPLPTDAQIAGVSGCSMQSELLTNGIPIGAMKELINGVIPGTEGSQTTAVQVDFRFEEPDSMDIGRFVNYIPDIILTRRERCRRAGKPDPELETSPDVSELSAHIFVEPRLAENNSTTKKFKLNQTSVVNLSPNLHDSYCARDKLTDLPSQPFENTNTVTNNDTTSIIQHSSFVPKNTPNPSTAQRGLFDNKITTAEIRKLGYHHQALPTTACHEVKASTYARLRLRTVSAPSTSTASPLGCQDAAEESILRSRVIPADIFNHTTLPLLPNIKEPVTHHRYMASIDVIQKQGLVRILATPRYSVELVERDNLGGVDLIVDPFTGVIYASLFSLPSECECLISRVSKLSWKYKRLIVILEGYPPAIALKASDETSGSLFAYTPPILKAIKRFRRGVDMSEGVGEKCETTMVLYAFPNTIIEAAVITRHIGDLAEELDETDGAIWGDRRWIGEATEDEENLAQAVGMNNFTAALVLSQVSLKDFVEMTAAQRQETFGHYVGNEAIAAFSADVDARFAVHRSSDKTEFQQDYHCAIDTHGSGTTESLEMDISI